MGGRGMILKALAKQLLGEANLGRLEFFRQPELRESWGGPFNGQKYRLRIFFDLLYQFPLRAIVETGTFRGTTTALFGATGLPVYSSEIHPRSFAYSRMRFFFQSGLVHLYQADSRSFLRGLGEDPSVPKDDVFFFLDAHWGDDLPLREELEIIFRTWAAPLVMIDDFRVSGTAYAYDSYGPDKTLDLGYIAPVVTDHNLATFFPAAAPSDETGLRRGSVVVCNQVSGAVIDAHLNTLVRASG
jgi:hypothetical protein